MAKKYNLKRPIEKKVRFRDEEWEYIKVKIKKSPFKNFQNFARLLIITGEIKNVDYSQLIGLNQEVARVGNNINQMARLANQFKEISPEDIQYLIKEVEALKGMVRENINEAFKQNRGG